MEAKERNKLEIQTISDDSDGKVYKSACIYFFLLYHLYFDNGF